MKIKGSPNTTHQVLYPTGSFMINPIVRENVNAKNTPNEMQIWLKLVNVPDIYVGDNYFMINGAKPLENPTQIP
jgi:hypothetical protein